MDWGLGGIFVANVEFSSSFQGLLLDKNSGDVWALERKELVSGIRFLMGGVIQSGLAEHTVFIHPILEQSTCWTKSAFHWEPWSKRVHKNTLSTVINLKRGLALPADRLPRRGSDAFIAAKWTHETSRVSVLFHRF